MFLILLVYEYIEKLQIKKSVHWHFSTLAEEVRRLDAEILRQRKDYDLLQEEKQQVLEELQWLKKLNSEQQALSMDQSQKIKELQRELEAKEELVKSCNRVLKFDFVGCNKFVESCTCLIDNYLHVAFVVMMLMMTI